MHKHIRLVGWALGLLALASLACSAPQIPFFAEPTSTPRPTRTSRPTFTPTPSDTPTPVNTSTPTRTPTPVATATFTPLPPTATFTPAPPTNTPTRRPPTNTPRPTNTSPPTNTPAPSFQFTARLGDTSKSNNCAFTGVNAQIQDRNGNPIAGYTLHVSGDGWIGADDISRSGYSDAGATTQYNAQITLSSGYPPKPGKWYVTIIDSSGGKLSNELTVYTDADSDEKPCGLQTFKGGGIQVVPVIIRQN